MCDGSSGRCFWRENNDKTMLNARTACQQDGGDLAVIETQDLFTFVKSNFGYTVAHNLGLIIDFECPY